MRLKKDSILLAFIEIYTLHMHRNKQMYTQNEMSL